MNGQYFLTRSGCVLEHLVKTKYKILYEPVENYGVDTTITLLNLSWDGYKYHVGNHHGDGWDIVDEIMTYKLDSFRLGDRNTY